MGPKKTTKSRSDTAVQGTNDSSIVSKCSTAQHGYFIDDFLQYFVAKKSRRSPLIHRGYYIRSVALEHCFTTFLQHHDENVQVVSLGAGFDSSYFRLKSKNLLAHAMYIEVDFPELVSRKAALILQQSELSDMLSKIKTHPNIAPDNIALHTEDYALVGVDLTQLDVLDICLAQVGFLPHLPTLFVSEVAIVYMAPENSTALIEWVARSCENAVFVVYEQIHPDDAFGLIMQSHFNKLGSTLRSLTSFQDLEIQKSRFISQGWSEARAIDMNQFYHQVLPLQERRRMEELEPFDEFEEWHLKCAHYALVCGIKGRCSETAGLMIPDASSALHTSDVYEEGQLIQNTAKETITWNFMHNIQDLCNVFGHSFCEIDKDCILLLGGFGDRNSQHCRVKDAVILKHKPSVQTCKAEIVGSHIERMYHTATVLPNKDILVIGGRTSPTKPLESLLRLRIETGISKDGDISNDIAQEDIADISCDKAGISAAESRMGDCRVLSEEMSQSGTLPPPRWRHTSNLIQINGICHILVFGGCTPDKPALNDCYLLNTSNYTWTKVREQGDVPLCRHSHSGDVYKEHLVICGGLSAALWPLNSIHLLDTNTWIWQDVTTNSLKPRYSHTSAVFDDRLFLLGGVNLTVPSPGLAIMDLTTFTCTEYDLAENSPELPILLHGHCSYISQEGNTIYVVGGGGNCFSFGTHFNKFPLTLNIPS